MSSQTTCQCPSFDPVPWSDFYDGVQVNAPAVPNNIIEYQLRQTAIDFASRTGIIGKDLFLDLQQGVQDYRICCPFGYRLHILRSVSVDNHRELQAIDIPPTDYIPYGTYTFLPPDKLLIGHDVDCDEPGGLMIRSSIIPTQDSCSISREVYDRYREIISDGALSRIFIMPGTSWYDPSVGGIMLRRYKLGINRAKNDKGRDYSGPRFMRAPRFV